MFELYFGKYLVEKNKITPSQYETILKQQQNTRAKLGLLAVSERLLTTRQAEEIHDIQKKMDRRFGDIAIEKGYLLAEEVTYLLNIQGNPYVQFVQTCIDNNILDIHEIITNLEQFQKVGGFSDSDLDALSPVILTVSSRYSSIPYYRSRMTASTLPSAILHAL